MQVANVKGKLGEEHGNVLYYLFNFPVNQNLVKILKFL